MEQPPPDRATENTFVPSCDPPPDWNDRKDELHCPMCEYNLHGLIEPRCPECGYRFTWAEMLDARVRLHPYLFEHHPESNFRSFWRTARGGFRPAKFWSTLHAGMPSRPRRLLLYWCLAMLLASLLIVGLYIGTSIETHRNMEAIRAFYSRNVKPTLNSPYSQAWLDRVAPVPTLPRLLKGAFVDRDFRAVLALTIIGMLWPWFTFLALMIFRISMRRARIQSIHVLRCVLYSFDVGLWLGPILLVTSVAGAIWMNMRTPTAVNYPFWWNYIPSIPDQAHLLTALVLGIAAWRLAVAYKRYLKFDHSFAAVLASQVILFLLFVFVAITTPTALGVYWKHVLTRIFLGYG